MNTNNTDSVLAELTEMNDALEQSVQNFSRDTETLMREITEAGSKADAAMTAVAAWLEEKAKQE